MENNSLNIYDKHIAFWGGQLSNFYPCEIIENEPWKETLDNLPCNVSNIVFKDFKWKSSEQLFMAYKAWTFSDYETFFEICSATNPKDAKKLGRKVKNYDDEIWSEVREHFMEQAVYAKFTQNENLKKFLLQKEFDGKDFVEGSPFDGIWGVKMDWRNPDIDNPENWNGINLLGKVINKVREKIKKEEYGK